MSKELIKLESTVTVSRYNQLEEFSKKLTPKERAVLIASKGVKIKEISKSELHNLILEKYIKANLELGYTKQVEEGEDDKILQAVYQLTTDLRHQFPNLTTKEFEQVMYYGVRGEFQSDPKEKVFLSVVAVYNWVKSYIDKIRKDVISKQWKFEEENSKVTLSEDEKRTLRIKYGIADLLEENNNIGKESYSSFLSFPRTKQGVLFDFLIDFKIINPAPTERRDTYKAAKKSFKSRIKKSDLPREDRYDYTDFIKDDFELCLNKQNKFFKLVVNEAKKEMLHNFLRELKESEIDLHDFLNDKLNEGNRE